MSKRSLINKTMRHKHADRIERARGLVQEGRVFETAGGWRLFSDSGSIYHIRLNGPRALNPYACDCKWGERFPDDPCSHVYAVDEYRATTHGLNRSITDADTRRRPIVVVVLEVR